MSMNNKGILLSTLGLLMALGVGIAIGTVYGPDIFKKAGYESISGEADIKSGEDLTGKSEQELSLELSEVMLPADEFSKLEDAIFQTGMGIMMAQAQSAGLSVTDDIQGELRKSIQEKYSRKYFADMNAGSMKDLSKAELVSIIRFYRTMAGRKFLEVSPKIIQTTMSAVQADLSSWLPKTVDGLMDKLKAGDAKEDLGEDGLPSGGLEEGQGPVKSDS